MLSVVYLFLFKGSLISRKYVEILVHVEKDWKVIGKKRKYFQS